MIQPTGCLSLPNIPNEFSYKFLILSKHVTSPSHIIVLAFTTLIIWSKKATCRGQVMRPFSEFACRRDYCLLHNGTGKWTVLLTLTTLHQFSFIFPQQASSIIALAMSDRNTGVCSVVMPAPYSLHAFKLTLLARCTARAANREYFPQRVLRRWKAIRCDITIWTSYCSLISFSSFSLSLQIQNNN